MAGDVSVPTITVRAACSSEGVFLRELAPRLKGPFWVETPISWATGATLVFVLELEGSTRHVRAVARVTAAGPNRLGLRLVELAPDSMQFPFAADTTQIDDVLLPGVWTESPHPFTEAPTPPHGVAVQTLLADATRAEPEQKTALYSGAERALVERTAAADAIPWSGGLKPLDLIGNYQLLDRLGRGGMAEVYVARALLDDGVEKVVALKLTLPEYGPSTEHGELFLQEARISAMLQHRGLIQVFDFGEAQGRPFLAMEYVRGRNLATLIRCMAESGGPSRAFALRVTLEIVQALEYLHSRTDPSGEYLRLVHRDITPSNVLVSEQGEVKIVDFGVASMLVTHPRTIAGKPGYMPPEQGQGKPPTPGWDLYAAGVVLRELLAPMTSPIAARAAHVNPDLRFTSAKQMAEALSAELQAAGTVDLGMMVRALCGLSLGSEQRKVAEATLKARIARPGGRGPVSRLSRAFSRSPRGRAIAAAVVVGLVAMAGLVARETFGARTLQRQLDLVDERMRGGALAGPGETALAALAEARSQAPMDPRVKARAAELARVFEMLGDTASSRGNDAEAAVHFEALAVAEPGRPGVLTKLIAARMKSQGR